MNWANCMSWMGVKKGEASMKQSIVIYINSMIFLDFLVWRLTCGMMMMLDSSKNEACHLQWFAIASVKGPTWFEPPGKPTRWGPGGLEGRETLQCYMFLNFWFVWKDFVIVISEELLRAFWTLYLNWFVFFRPTCCVLLLAWTSFFSI